MESSADFTYGISNMRELYKISMEAITRSGRNERRRRDSIPQSVRFRGAITFFRFGLFVCGSLTMLDTLFGD